MSRQISTQLNRLETLLITIKGKEPEFMNIEEASSFLKLKKSTLYNLVFQRGIPFYKKTKKLLFKKSELVEWVEQERVSSFVEVKATYTSTRGGY